MKRMLLLCCAALCGALWAKPQITDIPSRSDFVVVVRDSHNPQSRATLERVLAQFGISSNSPQAAALWGQMPPEAQSLLRTMGIRGFTDYDIQSLTFGVILPNDPKDPKLTGMLFSLKIESPTMNGQQVCAEVQALLNQLKKPEEDLKIGKKNGWIYLYGTKDGQFMGFAISPAPGGLSLMVAFDRSRFKQLLKGEIRMAKENHPLAAAFIDHPDYVAIGIKGYAPMKKAMCKDKSEAEVEADFVNFPWFKEVKALTLLLPYDANNVNLVLATGFKDVAQAQAMQAMITQIAPNLAALGLTIPAGQITNIAGLQSLVYSLSFSPEGLAGLVQNLMAAQQGGAPGQNDGDDDLDDLDDDSLLDL
ncbi:MAG: hypothetical protein ACI4YA_07095 [Candidatus Spyradenecus sp.]